MSLGARLRMSVLAASGLALVLALALAAPPHAAVKPTPKLGETLHLDPKKGKTAFSPPDTDQFRQLNGAREVPVETMIRSRTGRVEITSAIDNRRGTRTGVFYDFYPDVGGAVRIFQGKGRKAPTEAELVGGLGGCTPSPVASGPTSRRQVAINGAGGHRIIGRFSSATSRGANFVVIDRCDGTLTRVKNGSVNVRDFALEDTVTLRAKGRNRYLASATGVQATGSK